MLICLQLASLCKLASYINIIKNGGKPDLQTTKGRFICLDIIFGSLMPYLFFELAILMNIAKWIYYFLVVKTHRNIRHYEISMDIFAEREGHYQ